jgi:hypothetical protein
MAATWDHPKLGRFEYRGSAWTRFVDVPAFAAFSYDTGHSNAPRSTGRHPLVFGAFDERELPSAADTAVAERVLANHAALVDEVIRALWEDFNGRGPGSGMGWNGDLATVAAGLPVSSGAAAGRPRTLLPPLRGRRSTPCPSRGRGR